MTSVPWPQLVEPRRPLASVCTVPPAGFPWESCLPSLILSFLLLNGVNSCYAGPQWDIFDQIGKVMCMNLSGIVAIMFIVISIILPSTG